MTERKPYIPRQATAAQWFWFLAFMGAITRFPLLRVFHAEGTDSILNLIYYTSPYMTTENFYILPGFPALLRLGVWAGLDGVLWGRMMAAAAGLLFLIPLWKLSRRWVPVEMAGIICLMGLFSPLLWEWSIRAMSDTLFLALFLFCLERMVVVYIDGSRGAWWQACWAGAAAALVRPEGFLLLPWIAVLGEKSPAGASWGRRLSFLLAWGWPLYLLKDRLKVILLAYKEGMGMTEGASRVQIPFLNFIDHFYTYLSQPIYVFTPLVFWFAVLGLAKMVRQKGPEGEAFRKIILQIYTLIFLSRLVPTAYQDRHMLPFLPLLLIAAGYHLETFFESLEKKAGSFKVMFLRNGTLTLCLAWLALFSSAVMLGQNDSFGDIKRSAEFLKTLPPGAVIYTDEVPKTQYWSGRKVILMPYLAENTQFNPNPGDYVVLHSFYIPRLNFVHQHLVEAHDAQVVHEDFSMVVPLLTDVMEDPRFQNRTTSTAFRFTPQFFKSLVYHVRK